MTRAIPYAEDFYGDAFILDPLPRYAEMRALGPVIWLEAQQAYAVARYGEVVQVLRRPKVFSSGRGLSLNTEVNKRLVGSTLNSDDPDHARSRAITAVPIMPKSLAPLESFIAERAEALAEVVAGKSAFDAVADFAQVLPLNFVTELIGLSDAGQGNMLKWASATFNLFEGFNGRSETPADRPDRRRPRSSAH